MLKMETFNFKNATSKKHCHFIAANGFSPKVYNQIFKDITTWSIKSPLLRPLWNPSPPPTLHSWMDFADDLVPYVEEFQPKIVIGHSIGAVIWLLYSIKYNYSFDKIIMIDPALFPTWMYRIYPIIYKLNLQKRLHPLIKVTLNRKQTFSSFKEAEDNYKQKPIFSRIKEDILNDYITSMFEKNNNNEVSLVYSPQWESIIYEKGMLADSIIWKQLANITGKTEVVYLKGELSTICTDSVTKHLEESCSHFFSYEIPDTTHLLPFENPESVKDIISLHLET
tara:strand:- start:723 stop:1565 length:843 start_codon:yes stop_codon:yes gene_type:complete